MTQLLAGPSQLDMVTVADEIRRVAERSRAVLHEIETLAYRSSGSGDRRSDASDRRSLHDRRGILEAVGSGPPAGPARVPGAQRGSGRRRVETERRIPLDQRRAMLCRELVALQERNIELRQQRRLSGSVWQS